MIFDYFSRKKIMDSPKNIYEDAKESVPFLETIRQLIPNVYQGGGFYHSSCPFCKEEKVFIISDKQKCCYCFGCKKGGDILDIYQLLTGLDRDSAARELKKKYGKQI